MVKLQDIKQYRNLPIDNDILRNTLKRCFTWWIISYFKKYNFKTRYSGTIIKTLAFLDRNPLKKLQCFCLHLRYKDGFYLNWKLFTFSILNLSFNSVTVLLENVMPSWKLLFWFVKRQKRLTFILVNCICCWLFFHLFQCDSKRDGMLIWYLIVSKSEGGVIVMMLSALFSGQFAASSPTALLSHPVGTNSLRSLIQ